MGHARTWVPWTGTSCLRVAAALAACLALHGWLWPQADLQRLWIHGAPLPDAGIRILVVAWALTLLWPHATARGRGAARIVSARVLTAGVALVCLQDAATFASLRAEGRLAAPSPLSLSAVMGVLLCVVAWRWGRSAPGNAPPRTWQVAGYIALAVAVPSAGIALHLATFGETDHRQPADAAVVLGCAVRADGEPSPALRDRVMTACRLFHEGHVAHLVLSGGRDPDAPCSEPVCMARIARHAGVPDAALVLDETGLTTAATVSTLRRLAQARGWKRLIGVSHDYHLARIHLAARRAGLDLVTVPATETVPWPAKPRAFVREVLAFAWYALRG